jgi:hypothetical protein
MQKVILYLTIALVGVGLAVFISEKVAPIEGKAFATSAAYNQAMKEAIEAGDVPEMPACAETMELRREEDMVTGLSFICTDEAAREQYIAFIHEEYAWDIAADNDRVRMARQEGN